MMTKYELWHLKGVSRVGASTSPGGPLPPSGLCQVGHANHQHRQSPRLSCPSSARHRNLFATSQACNACPVPWELHTHCRPSAPACFSLSYHLVLCPPAPEDVPLREDSQPSSDASDPWHPGTSRPGHSFSTSLFRPFLQLLPFCLEMRSPPSQGMGGKGKSLCAACSPCSSTTLGSHNHPTPRFLGAHPPTLRCAWPTAHGTPCTRPLKCQR